MGWGREVWWSMKHGRANTKSADWWMGNFLWPRLTKTDWSHWCKGRGTPECLQVTFVALYDLTTHALGKRFKMLMRRTWEHEVVCRATCNMQKHLNLLYVWCKNPHIAHTLSGSVLSECLNFLLLLHLSSINSSCICYYLSAFVGLLTSGHTNLEIPVVTQQTPWAIITHILVLWSVSL